MTTAEGISFPRSDATGARSTTAMGRAVLTEAVRAADPALAAAIEGERDWRRRYPAHLRALEAVCARGPEVGVGVARAGLAALHDRFVVVRDGADVPLPEALDGPEGEPFGTEVVRGGGTHPRELALPYAGQVLRGDELRRQLDRWVAAGTVEPSCAEAVGRVLDDPGMLDLRGTTFALLGAGAELGPLTALCSWGADVLAVDLPREQVQAAVREAGRRGSGRLRLPTRGPRGGADLLTDAGRVRAWLAREAAGTERVVVGSYGYADGGGFVRLALAADAVTAALLADGLPVLPALLATPTDVFAVPREVADAARAGRRGPGRLLAPHYPELVRAEDGRELGLADCLVVQQGPNYALAKRLQRWRAIVALADGLPVSANVAPPTRTRSVLRNRLLAAGYRGASRFGVEVFAPETSSTLMAALLAHDLRHPPRSPDPRDLLVDGAAHGGLWRRPYLPRRALALAVLAGLGPELRTRYSG